MRFGLLGAVFGSVYAFFYFLIDHVAGGAIIVVCSFFFGALPAVLWRAGNIRLAANLYVFVLTAGFTGLSLVEGGMDGHAVAWLSVVPLCALVLCSGRDAVVWGKFRRLTPRPTGNESSNGLGLWIVDRMARSMGGQVFCRSEPGAGSTFGLVLPRYENTPDSSPRIRENTVAGAGNDQSSFDDLALSR